MSQHNAYSSLNDEDLLREYKHSRDNQLLGCLLQRYTMLLFGVAMKYLKDKDDAHDAVQQVFLKAITHMPEGDIANFKGWLYILMRNHCLQLLRDTAYMAGEDKLASLAAQEADKEEIRWKDYTLNQMSAALQELGHEQRLALELFYLKKCSYQQIMEQTGFTFTQVKSFIQNGKRNLKILLLRKLDNLR